MMDDFRSAAGKKANLQTLARGVNVVGFKLPAQRYYRTACKTGKKHGITTIRNFGCT